MLLCICSQIVEAYRIHFGNNQYPGTLEPTLFLAIYSARKGTINNDVSFTSLRY
jgi:hypothetical protein